MIVPGVFCGIYRQQLRLGIEVEVGDGSADGVELGGGERVLDVDAVHKAGEHARGVFELAEHG